MGMEYGPLMNLKDLEKAVQSKYAWESVFADGVRILVDDAGNVFNLDLSTLCKLASMPCDWMAPGLCICSSS